MKKYFVLLLFILTSLSVFGCGIDTTLSTQETTSQSTTSSSTTMTSTSSNTTNTTLTTFSASTSYESLFTGDWNRPGLFNKDGSTHEMPEEVVKTGITLDVVSFGAQPNNPGFNNYLPFKDAIDAALPGDEVYIPAGTYYFTGYKSVDGYYTHIELKSGIIFRGAGEFETTLVSMFSETSNQTRETTVISVLNATNVSLSGFTVTSMTSDDVLPDENNSGLTSTVFSAPRYGITIDTPRTITSADDQTHNIVIKNVTIEKFQRMGVRLRLSREVTIDTVTFRKAVNLGGGGAGYGISIQGSGYNTDWTNTSKDTIWNVVKNSTFEGPWIRHGVVIQYYSHNNLIENNTFVSTLLDSVDLHGEDEYSNEIKNNLITNSRQGAGVGVGNSGATHDASGRNNYIHHNTIQGGLRGIDVLYGSPKTIIAYNSIFDLTEEKSIGITLSDAPYTFIVGNTFENISGNSGGFAIKISYAFNALNPEKGIPNNIWITDNAFALIDKAIFIETYGSQLTIENNTFTNIDVYEFLSTKEQFVLPVASTLMNPVIGYELIASESNFITTEDPTGVQSQKNMKFKASLSETNYNRMIYAKFDLTEVQSTYNRVYLCFSAKAQEGMPTINVFGSTSYMDWSSTTITWNNSRLHDPFVAKTDYDPKVDNLTKIIDFTFPVAVYAFNTYYVDITDYIMNVLDQREFTMVMSNEDIEEVYMEVYNHLQTSTNQELRLVFTTEGD